MTEPFKAPEQIIGERHDVYLGRLAHAFEQWVNARLPVKRIGADGFKYHPPVRDRAHALEMLDDVDSLVRFCSVNMPDVERYNRGGEAFWRVVHWIAEMRADAATSIQPTSPRL